jgi:hypothetical protein
MRLFLCRLGCGEMVFALEENLHVAICVKRIVDVRRRQCARACSSCAHADFDDGPVMPPLSVPPSHLLPLALYNPTHAL